MVMSANDDVDTMLVLNIAIRNGAELLAKFEILVSVSTLPCHYAHLVRASGSLR